MLKPDMGSIFHIKKSMKYSGRIENYYVNYQNYQNLMLLTSSDTKCLERSFKSTAFTTDLLIYGYMVYNL